MDYPWFSLHLLSIKEELWENFAPGFLVLHINSKFFLPDPPLCLCYLLPPNCSCQHKLWRGHKLIVLSHNFCLKQWPCIEIFLSISEAHMSQFVCVTQWYYECIFPTLLLLSLSFIESFVIFLLLLLFSKVFSVPF